MELNHLLIIGLVMYVIGIYLAKVYQQKILFIVSGLLWFIPVTLVENSFIKIFSIVVFIVHILIAFYSDKESEY